MNDALLCPACGAANPVNRTTCERCAQPLSAASPAEETLRETSSKQQSLMQEPRVQIVRSSNRRKFLIVLLGSAVALVPAAIGIPQLAQIVKVAFHDKNFPLDSFPDLFPTSYSPDLNLMSMTKAGAENHQDATLYIWNFQQQRMITLPTGPEWGDTVFSPDNRYVLCQTRRPVGSYALDLWDIQAQKMLRSYKGDDYSAFSKIRWSPNGSQIALLNDKNALVNIGFAQLTTLTRFKPPLSIETFTWSPTSQQIAFVIATSQNWSIQIWDLQNQTLNPKTVFYSQGNYSPRSLTWSPDGSRIAALSDQQLHIIRVEGSLNSYSLDRPNDQGQLAWSPDSSYLAVAIMRYSSGLLSSTENTLSVWDTLKRKQVHLVQRMSFGIKPVLTWSKDGAQIILIEDFYHQENWGWP